MRPMDSLKIAGERAPASLSRQLVLYVLLPGLPLLLFFLMWRIALANAGVVLQSATSPDGAYIAEVVRRDPGGDASFDYYVRLRKTASKVADPLLGNEYRAFEQGSAVGEISLIWTDASHLTIHCDACANYKIGQDSWRKLYFRYDINTPLK